MFKRTTAINKLLAMTARIKIIPGGTSAGKTYGILPILIDKAAKTPLLEISVVSESVPHLRKGALKDFLKIMKDTGRYIDKNYNRTLLTYTFENGSYIEFFSADQEGKVRGPRRNILYVNECNNLSFETFNQLYVRTTSDIYLDFNPSHEFWVHKEFENDNEAEWLTLTYKDNEALNETIVNSIEKAREKGFFNPDGDIFDESNVKNDFWANWWRVYGLGLKGVLQEVIFQNWSSINSVPKEAKYVNTGLDYGYTNDPTAIVDRYIYNGLDLYDLICYKKDLSNREISKIILNSDFRRIVIPDSSEPKSNDELKSYGVYVYPAIKGADSINFGINAIKESSFLVTARSVELQKELRLYSWLKDRSGNITNIAIDAYNHGIDAMRYSKTHGMLVKKIGVINTKVN